MRAAGASADRETVETELAAFVGETLAGPKHLPPHHAGERARVTLELLATEADHGDGNAPSSASHIGCWITPGMEGCLSRVA